MNARNERPRPWNVTAAFTIVELLVAMSVTLVLVALSIFLTTAVAGFWSRASARLVAEDHARRVFDQLEADLQSLVWHPEGAGSFVVSIQPDPPPAGHARMAGETWLPAPAGRGKPGASEGSLVLPVPAAGGALPAVEAYRFGQAGVWLRLVAHRLWTPATPGSAPAVTAPVAVAYQVVRRAAPVGGAVYQLFRSQVAAPATLEAGLDVEAAAAYRVHDDTPQAPGNIRQPPVAALLAEGVIDFGVRLLDRNVGGGGEWRVLFPTEDVVDYATGGDGPIPAAADLMLRVLTAEGVKRITLLEYPPDGRGPEGEWWDVAERHSLVFTRRVELAGHPR